jgi:hypothetical protein
VIADFDWAIQFANPAFRHMFGLDEPTTSQLTTYESDDGYKTASRTHGASAEGFHSTKHPRNIDG